MTSSHFCSAERQYRNPLEYGGQKPPTAQWTTTGSGAVILSREGKGPYLTHVDAWDALALHRCGGGVKGAGAAEE